MALPEEPAHSGPIENPFGALYPRAGEGSGSSTDPEAAKPVVVLRSKKGDRAIEVEIPANDPSVSEWVVPVGTNPDHAQAQNSAGQESKSIQSYADRRPSAADREIQRTMPEPSSQMVAARRDIETDLGLAATEEELAKSDKSYLGAMDRIKVLFREGRLEASLLDTEELLKTYPMDPKLHEMRGTLLDRLGYSDLARQSWRQALKLRPSNEPLRRFLERRGERIPASEAGVKGAHS